MRNIIILSLLTVINVFAIVDGYKVNNSNILRIESDQYKACTTFAIDKNILLTANHCVHNKINLKLYSQNKDITTNIDKIVYNETYDILKNKIDAKQATIADQFEIIHHDMALIFLNKDLSLDNNFTFDLNEHNLKEPAKVIGYGSTILSNPDENPKQLYAKDANLSDICYMTNLTANNFYCATGSYKGDSGSPLLYDNNKILGIAVFASDYNNPSTRGLYIGYLKSKNIKTWVDTQIQKYKTDSSITYSFKKGWNLFSIKSKNDTNISNFNFNQDIKAIYGYDEDENKYITPNALYTFKGYWLYTINDINISINDIVDKNIVDTDSVNLNMLNSSFDKWTLNGTPVNINKKDFNENNGSYLLWAYDNYTKSYSIDDVIKGGSGFWIRKYKFYIC